MTRLLVLATCFSAAFAGMSGGDMMMGGDNMAAPAGGAIADSSMAGGEKSNSMSSGNSKSTETVKVDITINVISKSMGGSSTMQDMSSPMMAAGQTHQVTVGGGTNLVFSPSSVMAAVGDMVQFTFMATNHTLTQSTFPMPCVKMAGGQDSGFMANKDSAVMPPPTFMVQVMNTQPAWFYCKQKGHCGKGMTFSINPTVAKTQNMFMQAAMTQNGTAGAGMAGMGAMAGAMANSSAGASVMVAPPAASAVASSVAAVAAPVATSSMAASGGSSMTASGGSMMASGGSGECACSCLCGMAAFPAGAGMGMMGGMSGAIPATPA